jgi:hypothetical protein
MCRAARSQDLVTIAMGSPCGEYCRVTAMASLVLHAGDATATAAFYRAVDLELELDQHDGGNAHFACELGGVHVAIYPSEQAGVAPPRRAAGSCFPGFYVDSLDAAEAALESVGVTKLSGHEQMDWGCRLVVEDPDGRPVEINQREHC